MHRVQVALQRAQVSVPAQVREQLSARVRALQQAQVSVSVRELPLEQEPVSARVQEPVQELPLGQEPVSAQE